MSASITVFDDKKRAVYSAAIVNSDGWTIEEGPFRKTKAAAERDARAWSRETGIWSECERFKTLRRIYIDCWFWLYRRRLI